MKTLKELFEHQLKDLYSAEVQWATALRKIMGQASYGELVIVLEGHLEETKGHVARLEEICRGLGIKPIERECKVMKGMIGEAAQLLEQAPKNDLRDTVLIAGAQRVGHYGISGYGTAVRYARELGRPEISEELREILDDKYNADDRLDDLAEERLDRKAL